MASRSAVQSDWGMMAHGVSDSPIPVQWHSTQGDQMAAILPTSWLQSWMIFASCYCSSGRFCRQRRSSWLVTPGRMGMSRCWSPQLEVIFLGCSGRTSTLLSQLSVTGGIVEYQYGGVLKWRQEVGRRPKLEQIAINFTMIITFRIFCRVAQIRTLNKTVYCATSNHCKALPFSRRYLATVGGIGDRLCCVDPLPVMAHSGG